MNTYVDIEETRDRDGWQVVVLGVEVDGTQIKNVRRVFLNSALAPLAARRAAHALAWHIREIEHLRYIDG